MVPQSRYHFNICLPFCQFYKKVVLGLSEHGDVIETQTIILTCISYKAFQQTRSRPRMGYTLSTTPTCKWRELIRVIYLLLLAAHSGVVSPKFGGAKLFDFRRVTVFCLGYCLSKHKTTKYAKNLGGCPPGYTYDASVKLCALAARTFRSQPSLHCTVIVFALDWESHKSLKHDRECLTELLERACFQPCAIQRIQLAEVG